MNIKSIRYELSCPNFYQMPMKFCILPAFKDDKSTTTNLSSNVVRILLHFPNHRVFRVSSAQGTSLMLLQPFINAHFMSLGIMFTYVLKSKSSLVTRMTAKLLISYSQSNRLKQGSSSGIVSRQIQQNFRDNVFPLIRPTMSALAPEDARRALSEALSRLI